MEIIGVFLLLSLVATYGFVLRVSHGEGSARHRNAPFIFVQVLFILACVCYGIGGVNHSNGWFFVGTVLFDLTPYFLLMWSGLNIRAVTHTNWHISRPLIVAAFLATNALMIFCFVMAGTTAWTNTFLGAPSEYLLNDWYWSANMVWLLYLCATTGLFLYEVYEGWRTATEGANSAFRYRCITLLAIEFWPALFYITAILCLLYYRLSLNVGLAASLASLSVALSLPSLLISVVISIPLTDKRVQHRYAIRQGKLLEYRQKQLRRLLSRLPKEFAAIFPDKVEDSTDFLSTSSRRRALRVLVKRLDIIRSVFYRAELVRRGLTNQNSPIDEISPFPFNEEIVIWEEYIGQSGRSAVALFFAQHYIPVVLASSATVEQEARFYSKIERILEEKFGEPTDVF